MVDLNPERTHSPAHRLSPLQRTVKRAMDVLLSVPALALLSPVFLLLAALIRLTSQGPALFRQTRVGQDGREFVLYKFRTMTGATEREHRRYIREWIHRGESARQGSGSFKLEKDSRITPLGRFLRKYSLDELPQLFNVLRGEMSLVGPRPALAYEVSEYETWQRERLNATPGLTGLWQVSGRNRLSFSEMVELDLAYIRNYSTILDLKILLKTIPVVLGGTGK